jgi:hypothetical protein
MYDCLGAVELHTVCRRRTIHATMVSRGAGVLSANMRSVPSSAELSYYFACLKMLICQDMLFCGVQRNQKYQAIG